MSLRRPSANGEDDAGPVPDGTGAPRPEEAEWMAERERLLGVIAQQQRLAQTGLITAGLVQDVSEHVTVIKELAIRTSRGIDPLTWRKALYRIDAHCDELTEKMRTMLAFVGRREEPEVATFRAKDVVEQAVRLLRPLATAQGTVLQHETEQDALLVGEERFLVQALVNLGANALRACAGREGHTRIRVGCIEDRLCRIYVEDDGRGIPEYLRHRIFRPFAGNRGPLGGAGLGLFVVRQAVRRMGGSIRVETSPQGTCVQVNLPIAGRD